MRYKLLDRAAWQSDTLDQKRAVELFINVFSSPPRHEVWNDQTATAFFVDSMSRDGFTFLGVEDDAVRSFAVGGFVGADVAGIVPEIGEFSERHYYLAAIAVAEGYRNSRIGRALLRLTVHRAFELGAEAILIRTLEDSPEMIKLLRDHGFAYLAENLSTIGGVSSRHLLWGLGQAAYGNSVKHYLLEVGSGTRSGKQFRLPGYDEDDARNLFLATTAEEIDPPLLDVRQTQP